MATFSKSEGDDVAATEQKGLRRSMRLGLALLAFVLLALMFFDGPANYERQPPEAYAAPADRLAVRFPILQLFHEVCVKERRRLPSTHCYRFDAPRRWTGIMVQNDYFDDYFFPDQTISAGDLPKAMIYGVINLPARANCRDATCHPDPSLTVRDENWQPMAFAITFIGRRTAVQGNYGHMGYFGHEIVMDRLISQREIQLPK